MMSNELFESRLLQIVGKEQILKNEPMKMHTTFRVGGPADYLVTPCSEEEISGVLALCRECEMPVFILGKGSNLLVGDKGIRGVVVKIARDYSQIFVEGEKITAQAGASLAQIAAKALEEELAGFEFAAGIPGCLGGAVMMNAGAYGGEMKDVIRMVTVLDKDGQIRQIPADEMEFGYRTSVVEKNGYVVLGAEILLHKGAHDDIKAVMDDLRQKRVSKQPLEFPSAGSTFKRPEGYFAGKLIQDAGLRGYSVGDAQVSEKHCGFVINKGQASAAQILQLIEDVKERVLADSNILLEPEVKRVGEF